MASRLLVITQRNFETSMPAFRFITFALFVCQLRVDPTMAVKRIPSQTETSTPVQSGGGIRHDPLKNQISAPLSLMHLKPWQHGPELDCPSTHQSHGVFCNKNRKNFYRTCRPISTVDGSIDFYTRILQIEGECPETHACIRPTRTQKELRGCWSSKKSDTKREPFIYCVPRRRKRRCTAGIPRPPPPAIPPEASLASQSIDSAPPTDCDNIETWTYSPEFFGDYNCYIQALMATSDPDTEPELQLTQDHMRPAPLEEPSQWPQDPAESANDDWAWLVSVMDEFEARSRDVELAAWAADVAGAEPRWVHGEPENRTPPAPHDFVGSSERASDRS